MGDSTQQADPVANAQSSPVIRRAAHDGSTPARPIVRSRPDPGAMRLAVGFVGLATTSAIVSAMLAPAPAGSTAATTVAALTDTGVAPEVVHVAHYIQLKPGETAPPQAVVQQQAAPAPRIVTVTTRQSGVKK